MHIQTFTCVESVKQNEMVYISNCVPGTEAYVISKGNLQMLLWRQRSENVSTARNLSLSVHFCPFIAGGCKSGTDWDMWCWWYCVLPIESSPTVSRSPAELSHPLQPPTGPQQPLPAVLRWSYLAEPAYKHAMPGTGSVAHGADMSSQFWITAFYVVLLCLPTKCLHNLFFFWIQHMIRGGV